MANGGQMSITNRELLVFLGSVVMALVILAGGGLGWFDPLTAGIVVVTVVGLFFIGQWLEAKGIFGSGMTMVWMVLSLGIAAILAGLIARGYLPFMFYSTSAFPASVVSNALLYTLLIVSVIAAIIVIYVAMGKKQITLPLRKSLRKS